MDISPHSDRIRFAVQALVWAALSCLCVTPAFATGRFVSWTTEDGLPQNSINAIAQTEDGYIWLATFGGLVRYDGVQFTIFDKGNTKGLNSNRILCFLETPDGALWIGTEGGSALKTAAYHDSRTEHSRRSLPPTAA